MEVFIVLKTKANKWEDNDLLQEGIRKSYMDLVEAHDFAQIGSWGMDLKRNRSYWSEEAYRIYDIFSEKYERSYEEFLEIVHPDDRARIDRLIHETKDKAVIDMEYSIKKNDGTIRNIRQLVKPIFARDGELMYLYGTIQDITGMKEFQNFIGHAEETIDRIEKRFQVLVQQSSDVFEIISPDYTIQYISPAIEKIVGQTPEEQVGKNALDVLEDSEKQAFIKMVDHVLEFPEERSQGDIALKNKDGEVSYLTFIMSNQLMEPSVQGIVINWRDITERIEKQKEIEYIATHDELTKLPSRVCLKKKMAELCEDKSRGDSDFALMMLDLDGFRYVNDALGYQLGDQLIVQVSERLQEFLGGEGYLCRYSGDQFAIIIENLNKSWEYEQVVKKITALFKEACKVGFYELDITVSMGISMFPYDEKDPDLLINYANISLLRSKHEGKNRYKFYSSEIGLQIYKQVVLRNDLMKAIERKQFEVYYQAQVKLESGEILAAEALIRWNHPEWGMVSPNEFISLAEETGFIINLGNWMLQEVCRNYKTWMEQGKAPIKISVNYSSIQFYERNFVENIIKTINENGLDPHFLIMEITESVFMKNPEKAIVDIKRLQAKGIQVALDDFGTGFSSLSYLNSFNIDILKIDRSFIKNMMLDEASTIITRSVIDLAQELRIKLVAEGIENNDQLTYLKDLNCYTGQGFLYNKPMPISEFEQLLTKEKCVPMQVICEKEEEQTSKRRYLRIKLPKVLKADMAVVKVPGQKYKVGTVKVDIRNISSGGLCFRAEVQLPVNKDLMLRFYLPMQDGKETEVCGYPLWAHEIDDNCYEYGVKFDQDSAGKIDLTMALYSLCKEMYTFNSKGEKEN